MENIQTHPSQCVAARLTTRQDHHVKCGRLDILQSAVRSNNCFSGTSDWPSPIQPCVGHLKTRLVLQEMLQQKLNRKNTEVTTSTPPLLNTSAVITASISSAPSARMSNAVFGDILNRTMRRNLFSSESMQKLLKNLAISTTIQEKLVYRTKNFIFSQK